MTTTRRHLLALAAVAPIAPALPGLPAPAETFEGELLGILMRPGRGPDAPLQHGGLDLRRDAAGRWTATTAHYQDIGARTCPPGADPLLWALGLIEEQGVAWSRDRAEADAYEARTAVEMAASPAA